MQTTNAKPRQFNPLLRCALAIALVAAALFLSLALQVSFGNPFWLFFPVAVIASTWFGGRGPGWLAVALSTLAVLYYFIPPIRSFAIKPRDAPFFFAFIACELIANRLISWRKQIEESLRQSRDELEARVEERTVELKSANDALLNQMAEQRRTEEVHCALPGAHP
jgi:K+-sensing histidine kinase KdpD